MAVLNNPKHEEFAQLVGTGMKAAPAYRKLYPKTKRVIAESSASNLRKIPKVLERIAEVRAAYKTHLEADAKKSLGKRFLTLDRKRELLYLIAETAVHGVDEHSPLCQSIEYRTTEGNKDREGFQTVKIKMPDKLAAIKLDALLAGELIEKVEVEEKAPRETLEELRARMAAAKAKHRAPQQ